MGLLKVEVENFKSYVGRHVIGPFDRFTCIVGPNGSGKSNVMDAITFCLGIGSSHLRSSSIKSLIHTGCDYASVSLFITHLDKRIILRRDVNINGKSAYSIDEGNVGYEVFRECVENMNMLVNVRNFLIFQGDIDKMASMTPMELTRLFEGMSGSIELKDEYDKKMIEQNKVLRECALLFEERKEVMSRMNEAKEVKEQEDVFTRLVERREVIQREIILHKLRDGVDKMHEMTKEILRLEDEERNVRNDAELKENEVDEHRTRMNESRREYLETEIKMSKQRERVNEGRRMMYERGKEEDKNKVVMIEKEIEVRNKERMIEEKKDEIERRRNELERIEMGYRMICDENEGKILRLNDMMKNMNGFEEMEQDMRRRCREDQEIVNGLDLEICPKINLKKQYEEKKRILKDKDDELRRMMKEKRRVRSNVVLKIDTLERSEYDLKERIRENETRYERLICEENEKNDELSRVLEDILRIKGRRRVDNRSCVIQNTVENLKNIFPGVDGRVIDLIKPTQARYDIALSVLIGSHDQSVVVDNEVTAVSCINFIKEKKMCRMTFLPIQNIKDIDERDIMRSDSGYEGLRRACDTVVYDVKYKKIIRFILRESLIADNLDIAKDVCYRRGVKTNICTLNGIYIHGRGQLISTGGVIGGKFKEDELNELIVRRMRILDELKRIQEMKNTLCHVEICRDRMNMWKEARMNEIEELRKLDEMIEDGMMRLNDNMRIQEDIEGVLRNVDEEIDECEKKRNEVMRRMEEIEIDVFSGIFPNSYFKSYNEYKECNEDDSFDQRSMEYEDMRDRMRFRIDIIEREMNDIMNETDRIKNDVNETRMVMNEADIDGLNEELKVLEEECRMRLSIFERIRGGFREINEELKTIVSRKNELDRRILQDTSIKERIEEEIKEMMNFGILEEMLIPLKREENPGMMDVVDVNDIDFSGLNGSIEELNKELDEIDKKMSNQVPFVKMEENDDQLRYIRINSEYERLKENAIVVKKEFNEIKRMRMMRFMECFEKVNKEISRIYKSLTMTETSEGNACLVLENTTEPFKEGMKFHLMPPNKRFREVRLLSGGEKTMAILSLFFSFHSYRPVPFYVFDEIDSALDKVNVSRIISFMVSCDVQFIVITLKPILFQHSDSLVGIYKDSHENCSKILTYRLSDPN